MRPFLTSTLLVLTAAAALAQELPNGIGVETPSGSVFRTEVARPWDADDYVFAGYPGMSLTAAVQAAKGSALAPALRVLRPDGSIVVAADGLRETARPSGASVRFRLDATGKWKVRVSTANGTTGEYAVTLKTGKPRVAAAVLDGPDANGQLRFAIPAQGGARIGWSLSRNAGSAQFHSLVDPRGQPVAGFAGGVKVKPFRLAADLPLGDYVLTFDAPAATGPVKLRPSLVPPKAPKRRVAWLSASEPDVYDTVEPKGGGPGVLVTVRADGLVDPYALSGAAGLHLGTTPLLDVELINSNSSIRGRVPVALPVGRYDVVVTSTGGQRAVLPAAFEREPVETPVVESIDPPFGSIFGAFEIVLTGRHLRPEQVRLLFDGVQQSLDPTVVDDRTLRFMAPPHPAATVTLGLRDVGSQLDSATTVPLEYVSTPRIRRVLPSLIAVLAVEPVTLEGTRFSRDDRVFLETATPGVFEELTASQTTYVDGFHHRFVPPLRPKGEYQVYVEDLAGRPSPRKPRTLGYFSFADVTAASGLAAAGAGTDSWDAATSTLADLDGDGDLDLVLSRRGGVTAAASSETRVLRNDGHGGFADATSAVMPAAGADDWRADRVVAADIDGDRRTDLVLTTNSVSVPPAGRSHSRLLMNELRGGTGSDANDRVLRDRTLDLMAPVRTMRRRAGAGAYVSDDWRGLDLWVGDLDKSGAGPPEIVLAHDEVKNDDNPNAVQSLSGVYCDSYCPSSPGSTYGYAFYWGGSRRFVWDRNARNGLGRYKFDPGAFPRQFGPVARAPGYAPYYCSARLNAFCKGTFTPFTGKRLAVADLHNDGRLDVAVLSDRPVLVLNRFVSALQLMMQVPGPSGGSAFKDMSAPLTALGYDLSGDTLAMSPIELAEGNRFGVIALTWSQFRAGRTLTLLRFGSKAGDPAVEDVTYTAFPLPDATDGFQASQLRFVDVDGDRNQDLVLLADAAPVGGRSALRVLRYEPAGDGTGAFRRTLDTLTDPLLSATEHLEGVALAVGDVTGDGLLDFVLSRVSPTGGPPDTRILSTVK